MSRESTVTEKQLDAIREVVNIGAGHAATALSGMTNLRVMISVPRIEWIPEGETLPAAGDDAETILVSVPVEGPEGVAGERASLILARDTALRMVALLLGRDADVPIEESDLGRLERSTLMELGNIVCASYVGVLGTFLGEGVMIGAPALAVGSHDAASGEPGPGLAIETDFSIQGASFDGVFVLNHSEVSFRALLAALGLGAPTDGTPQQP